MSGIVECTSKYKVQFDGTVDAYVEVADRMARTRQVPGYEVGLASYDGGDATGFYIEMWDKHHDINDGTWVHRSETPPLLVTVTREDDFFVWDPPPHTEGGSNSDG